LGIVIEVLEVSEENRNTQAKSGERIH